MVIVPRIAALSRFGLGLGVCQDEEGRAVSSADSLIELVQFIEPGASVPCRLFPGGRYVTPSIRVAQLAFGCIRLISLYVWARPVGIIYGDGLVYLNGWVGVSIEHLWRTVISSVLRFRAFIPVAMSHERFAGVFASIGFDMDASLQVYLSQNGYLVLRGRRDGQFCIAHYGRTSNSRAAVRRHVGGLVGANRRLTKVIPGLIPTISVNEDQPGHTCLIQLQLHGRMFDRTNIAGQDFNRIFESAMQPLKDIYLSSRLHPRPFDQNCCKAKFSYILDEIPIYATQITKGISIVDRWVAAQAIFQTPAHGDYACRNLIFNSDMSKVIGIIDWEWYWEGGVPGLDALILLLDMEAMQHGCTFVHMLASFLGGRELDSAFVANIKSIRYSFGLSSSDLWHIGVIAWLRLLWIGCVMTEPISAAWLEDAVMAPARAIDAAGGSDDRG